MILIVAAERAQIFDLGGLFRSKRMPRAWGRLARAFCDATIWLAMFLVLVGNLIVAAASIDPLLQLLPEHAVGESFRVALVTLAVLPLCFLDQQHLAFSSSLGVVANIYLLGFVLLTFAVRQDVPAENCCLFDVGPGAIIMMSVLTQSVSVQMCVLPMYEELEQRSPRRFAGCLAVSFSCALVLFVSFSCVAYLIYGPGVSSNVLDDLPGSPLGDSVRVGMGISCIAVYPIMLMPMIAPIVHSEERAKQRNSSFHIPSPMSEAASSRASPASLSPSSTPRDTPLLFRLFAVPEDGTPSAGSPPRLLLQNLNDESALIEHWPKAWTKTSNLATCFLVMSSAFVAVWCPDLGEVNILSGAVGTFGMVGFAPGLVGIYLLGRHGLAWRLSMVALILLGGAATVLGIIHTRRQVGQGERTCMWLLPS